MGPTLSPVSACAIGNTAIGEAFRLIRYGEVDVMFAGGTDAAITDLSIAALVMLQRYQQEMIIPLKPVDHLMKIETDLSCQKELEF